MRRFSFGSFYGVSAPLAVMLSESDLDKVLGCVDSLAGFNLMKNLHLELQFFEKQIFESDKFKLSLDHDKLFSKNYGTLIGAEDLRSFKVGLLRMTKHFNTSDDNYVTESGKVISKEIWEKIKSSMEAEGSVVKKEVKVGNETEVLSDEEHKVLALVYARATQKVGEVPRVTYVKEKVLALVKDNLVESQSIYGNKVSDLYNMGNIFIMNDRLNKRYYEQFSAMGKDSLKESGKRLKEDLERVMSPKKQSQSEKIKIELGEDESLNLLYNRLESEGIVNNYSLFMSMINGPSRNEMLEDLNVYLSVEKFMGVVKTYDEEFFQKILGVEDVESVFSRLEDLGIIGFNKYPEEMFKDVVRNVNLKSYVSKDVDLTENERLFENLKVLASDLESKLEYAEAGVVI